MNLDAIPTEPVESSNIAAIGYDWPSATLAVVFPARWIYHYAPVPRPLFLELKRAKSIGAYFSKFIRGNPSIQAIRWCDCGQFVIDGVHLDSCVRLNDIRSGGKS